MKNFRDAALASALNMALVIGFFILTVWWMQSNFGAISALATVGGVVMATVLYFGVRIGGHLVRDSQRAALENFTDGIAAIEETRTAVARGQKAQQMAAAKITVLDYQHQLRQQEQTQRMLTDARRSWEAQAQQPQTAAPVWAMDGGEGDDVRYYE